MNKNTPHRAAFTLIELLMVIAIIGILAGILIPAIGAVKKQANLAASKSQLSNYVNAIGMFKNEYKYYPRFGSGGGAADYTVQLSNSSTGFIQTLSGREPATGDPISSGTAQSTGNRRKIAFHSFSDNEFLLNDDDTVSTTQLADRFNNVNITITIDGDGNGFVRPTGAAQEIRKPVTAHVDADGQIGAPAYTLWD